MFVKVCGITRMEDAAAAVDAGARALGFVFWPKSPRFVDPFHARAIVAKLPPFVTPVGLFVNQPHEYVTGVASLVRLAPCNSWRRIDRLRRVAQVAGDSGADAGRSHRRVARAHARAARRARSGPARRNRPDD
jgi:phosphoribosylanthranilate isomerase